MFPSPFQSTHPLRGATWGISPAYRAFRISIHAPLAGCDHPARCSSRQGHHFNPRTPCGVRLRQRRRSDRAGHISIHAPLAGCDPCSIRSANSQMYFNPRTPCGVRQNATQLMKLQHLNFNPRTPRGVRTAGAELLAVPGLISIHAPLAGCDCCERPKRAVFAISIHAPLAGCDNRERIRLYGVFGISIHAPLAGCDGNRSCASTTTTHFNPRTPYGVRRSPTPPPPRPHEISIHAPLTGCDLVKSISRFARNTFQSTHPSRGATCSRPSTWRTLGNFNPRTPCGVRRQ